MSHRRTSRPSSFLLFSLACTALACGASDPTGSGGEGTLSFTTWGEEYIQVEIPPAAGDEDGFVDGWTVVYDEFFVNFQNIVVANQAGDRAASMPQSMLFNNKVEGVKSVIDFPGIRARAWDRVSYEIAPVTAATSLSESATEADKAKMIAGGYSVYVAGTARKQGTEKRFAWGFALGTRYNECHSERDGRDEAGVVVTNNAQLDVELTTHGDHLFYDRLQSSPDPSIVTSLRFDALAAADANADGEVTLEELNARPLDVRLYDPSGLGAATHGAFVSALARTIGHFRGEGECTVTRI